MPLRLLELLRVRPTYGYLLLEKLRQEEGLFGAVGPSVLYPTLARLTARGLVRTYYGEESRGPIRKYYELTPQGREAIGLTRQLILSHPATEADRAPPIAGSPQAATSSRGTRK